MLVMGNVTNKIKISNIREKPISTLRHNKLYLYMKINNLTKTIKIYLCICMEQTALFPNLYLPESK